MTTLRVKQTTESTSRYRVELSLDGDGLVPQIATASFPFEMSSQDQEDDLPAQASRRRAVPLGG